MTSKPGYAVKRTELVMAGPNVQARVFTLAPGENIPWHYHDEITDHYFALQGTLVVRTREPDDIRELQIGDRHQITPGIAHFIANERDVDCRFLLLQGGGTYDWIKVSA